MPRAGLVCGLIAPILWAAVIVIAGKLRMGFDHLGQYISELGERGSSTDGSADWAAREGLTSVLSSKARRSESGQLQPLVSF